MELGEFGTYIILKNKQGSATLGHFRTCYLFFGRFFDSQTMFCISYYLKHHI